LSGCRSWSKFTVFELVLVDSANNTSLLQTPLLHDVSWLSHNTQRKTEPPKYPRLEQPWWYRDHGYFRRDFRRFGSEALPYVVRSTSGLLSHSYTLLILKRLIKHMQMNSLTTKVLMSLGQQCAARSTHYQSPLLLLNVLFQQCVH